MIHTKRMILVPEEQAESNNSIPQPAAPVNSFYTIDKDIENILFQKNISDHDKYMMYSDVVNKYLLKFNAARENLKSKKEHSEEDEIFGVEKNENEMEWQASIEDKQNFTIVKNLLQQSSDVTWDRNGSTFVFGEEINANINELIKNLFEDNKKPPGWGIFEEAVKKLNIPPEYLPSKKRKLETNDDKSKIKYRKLENLPASKRKNEENDTQPKRVKLSTAQGTKRKLDSELESGPKKKFIIPTPSRKRKLNDDNEEKIPRKKIILPAQTRKRKNQFDDDDIISIKKSKQSNEKKRKNIFDDAPAKKFKTAPKSDENTKKRKNKFDDAPAKRFKTTPQTKKRSILAEEGPGGKRRKLELPVGTKNKNAGKIKWIAFK